MSPGPMQMDLFSKNTAGNTNLTDIWVILYFIQSKNTQVMVLQKLSFFFIPRISRSSIMQIQLTHHCGESYHWSIVKHGPELSWSSIYEVSGCISKSIRFWGSYGTRKTRKKQEDLHSAIAKAYQKLVTRCCSLNHFSQPFLIFSTRVPTEVDRIYLSCDWLTTHWIVLASFQSQHHLIIQWRKTNWPRFS